MTKPLDRYFDKKVGGWVTVYPAGAAEGSDELKRWRGGGQSTWRTAKAERFATGGPKKRSRKGNRKHT